MVSFAARANASLHELFLNVKSFTQISMVERLIRQFGSSFIRRVSSLGGDGELLGEVAAFSLRRLYKFFLQFPISGSGQGEVPG